MNKILLIPMLILLFMCVTSTARADDATGIWNSISHSHWNNCGGSNVPQSAEVGLLQNGSTFIVAGYGYAYYGNISGNNYTFSDKACLDGGVASATASGTMTSETTATDTVNWSWSGPGGSCSGGYQETLTKQSQASPVHDATGRWTFNQYDISSNCGSPITQISSGDVDITQTGNRVTAVDYRGYQYRGFVNGTEYHFFISYLDGGFRVTEWVIIMLSSSTQGSGSGSFVWDTDCGACSGSWNISITKKITEGHPDYCAESGPCSEGEGDCDGDSECASGLICAQDVGANYGWSPLTDVCVKPNRGRDYCTLNGT
jgi:hypothetical protein